MGLFDVAGEIAAIVGIFDGLVEGSSVFFTGIGVTGFPVVGLLVVGFLVGFRDGVGSLEGSAVVASSLGLKVGISVCRVGSHVGFEVVGLDDGLYVGFDDVSGAKNGTMGAMVGFGEVGLDVLGC